jgi:hypothetical protein
MPKIVSLPNLSQTAQQEGWSLQPQHSGAFAGKVMIVRDAAKNRFECDVDAEQYVRIKAARGSVVHRVALEAHKRPALFK